MGLPVLVAVIEVDLPMAAAPLDLAVVAKCNRITPFAANGNVGCHMASDLVAGQQGHRGALEIECCGRACDQAKLELAEFVHKYLLFSRV